MLFVESIYVYFGYVDFISVVEVFKGIENLRWIWNGDGFLFLLVMFVVKFVFDFVLYVLCFLLEMIKYKELFLKFGIQIECDVFMLFDVFSLMKEKYDNGKD